MSNFKKKLVNILPLGFLTVLLSFGCSSIKVSSDYDTKANFKAYKTFSLSQSINDLRLSPDNQEIMKSALIGELNARGYLQSNSVSPDLFIEMFMKYDNSVGTTESTDVYGIRIYPYGVDFSTTTIDYHNFASGTLIIDLIDGKSNLLVWQGRGTTDIKLNETDIAKEKLIKDAIKKIFKAYPVKAL
jgi:hypothetical protein